MTLDYVLDVPAGDYRVEFFTNGAADTSGYGPGEQLAHFELMSHAGNGAQALHTSFSCPKGAIISATTTELDASGGFGATSEFSLAVPWEQRPLPSGRSGQRLLALSRVLLEVLHDVLSAIFAGQRWLLHRKRQVELLVRHLDDAHFEQALQLERHPQSRNL